MSITEIIKLKYEPGRRRIYKQQSYIMITITTLNNRLCTKNTILTTKKNKLEYKE